ncbi:MAG: hypothetical protein KIT84_41275 [Labilithrix sp.]|nr:hypothetical protein [Labilithrix sp.]MCW5817503.1 hypothetical protein [Labilithrix sp.]
MGRGVTCRQCGASTPLPDDLRVPSFACQYCRAQLVTAAYAGAAAVSADALLGHVGAAMRGERTDAAPRFEGSRSAATRAAECRHCRAPVAVPLDVTVHTFRCAPCGREQRVNEYVSDGERLAIDLGRQVAGNDALARLRAEGVECSRCGGKNAVPDDGSVQIVCQFCKAAVLLSDHVDASAVARARLKHGIHAARGEIVHKRTARDKLIIIGAVIAAAVIGVLAFVMQTR